MINDYRKSLFKAFHGEANDLLQFFDSDIKVQLKAQVIQKNPLSYKRPRFIKGVDCYNIIFHEQKVNHFLKIMKETNSDVLNSNDF